MNFPTANETIDGLDVELMMVETWDGLYAPIGVVKPDGDGPFPIVLLASGNGGEGLDWLRDAFANRGFFPRKRATPAPGCGIAPRSNSDTTMVDRWFATSARDENSSTVPHSSTRTRSPSSSS